MNTKLKAFATTTIPGIGKQMPILSTGEKVFMANAIAFNQEDLEFGREFKNIHGYCLPEYGVIIGSNANDDFTEHVVTILLITSEGQPLAEGAEGIRKFHITANTPFDLSQWSDNEEAVLALCERENEEAIHGLNKIVDLAQSKIHFIKNATRITSKEVRQPSEMAREVISKTRRPRSEEPIKKHSMFEDAPELKPAMSPFMEEETED
jgi:hypothetical protein